MDQQAFREFVAMLWGIPVRPEKNIFNVVRSYISWKCRLPPEIVTRLREFAVCDRLAPNL